MSPGTVGFISNQQNYEAILISNLKILSWLQECILTTMSERWTKIHINSTWFKPSCIKYSFRHRKSLLYIEYNCFLGLSENSPQTHFEVLTRIVLFLEKMTLRPSGSSHLTVSSRTSTFHDHSNIIFHLSSRTGLSKWYITMKVCRLRSPLM